MLKHSIILFVFLVACGVPKAEYDKLKSENEELRKNFDQVKQQYEELDYLANNSEVSIADTRVEEITSKFNGQKYKLKIKFPKGYENSTEKYPVLYVLDAETNFGGVSYIVQRLIKDKLIPKIIVVGIAYGTNYRNFYKLRSRDLTPVEDRNLKIGGAKIADPTGGAPVFSKFLELELFPFVKENFRIRENERAIYGHSYGGLFGSYALLNQSHLFNKYLLLSPSLWYKDDMMIKEVTTRNLNLKSTKLYMASGELEGRIDDLQIEFIRLLKGREIQNLRIESEVIENETHRTIFGVGFTNGLRFLYTKEAGIK